MPSGHVARGSLAETTEVNEMLETKLRQLCRGHVLLVSKETCEECTAGNPPLKSGQYATTKPCEDMVCLRPDKDGVVKLEVFGVKLTAQLGTTFQKMVMIDMESPDWSFARSCTDSKGTAIFRRRERKSTRAEGT